MVTYTEALVMLDKLQLHIQAENAQTCAQMEWQELRLMRLQQLRQTLKPQDSSQMATIADYYRREMGDSSKLEIGV